jgi:hypothetical protein
MVFALVSHLSCFTHTHTQDEVSGNRVRRQRPSESSGDSALPGGSEDGSDVEAYEEYDEDDEEDEDDSHIASSILTPAPPGVSFLLFFPHFLFVMKK